MLTNRVNLQTLLNKMLLLGIILLNIIFISSTARIRQPQARAEFSTRRDPLARGSAKKRVALPPRAATRPSASTASTQVPAQGAATCQQLHTNPRILQPLHRRRQTRRQRRFWQIPPIQIHAATPPTHGRTIGKWRRAIQRIQRHWRREICRNIYPVHRRFLHKMAAHCS